MAKKNNNRNDYDDELQYNNEPEWIGITHSAMGLYIITHTVKDYFKMEIITFFARWCAYVIVFWFLVGVIFFILDYMLGGILSHELFIELKDIWQDIFGS